MPGPPCVSYGLGAHSANIDDPEVAELRRRLVSLSLERQARILEGVLTPGLRLRVLAEQVRHQAGQMTDANEAIAERELDDAVRGVRDSLTRGRQSRPRHAGRGTGTPWHSWVCSCVRIRGARPGLAICNIFGTHVPWRINQGPCWRPGFIERPRARVPFVTGCCHSLFFYVEGNTLLLVHGESPKGSMVLVHGFHKKTQRTPSTAIALARKRMKEGT